MIVSSDPVLLSWSLCTMCIIVVYESLENGVRDKSYVEGEHRLINYLSTGHLV